MRAFFFLLVLSGCASSPPLPELTLSQALSKNCKRLGANYSTNDPEWARSVGGNAYITLPKGIYAVSCP